MPGDIHDNMTADEVWAVIEDVLGSVYLAETGGSLDSLPTPIADEVASYVTNHYGD